VRRPAEERRQKIYIKEIPKLTAGALSPNSQNTPSVAIESGNAFAPFMLLFSLLFFTVSSYKLSQAFSLQTQKWHHFST